MYVYIYIYICILYSPFYHAAIVYIAMGNHHFQCSENHLLYKRDIFHSR